MEHLYQVISRSHFFFPIPFDSKVHSWLAKSTPCLQMILQILLVRTLRVS